MPKFCWNWSRSSGDDHLKINKRTKKNIPNYWYSKTNVTVSRKLEYIALTNSYPVQLQGCKVNNFTHLLTYHPTGNKLTFQLEHLYDSHLHEPSATYWRDHQNQNHKQAHLPCFEEHLYTDFWIPAEYQSKIYQYRKAAKFSGNQPKNKMKIILEEGPNKHVLELYIII